MKTERNLVIITSAATLFEALGVCVSAFACVCLS